MSDSTGGRPKLAILTNLLAPYRVPIFQTLAKHFDVTVLFSGREGNRGQWRDLEHQSHDFSLRRVKGFTYVWTKRAAGAALDTKYLHVDPGLFPALVRLRPDAIITDEMGFRSLAALVYGRLFRRPVWVWWGGTKHTERGIGRAKHLFRKRFGPLVARWFSYGITSTEYLASLGVDSGRVVELQNCVQEAQFLDRGAPAFEIGPRPVLLCVGRLVPGKGLDLLFRAAAAAQAEGQTFSILVVGDGPAKQSLVRTVAELGLRNVHFREARAPGGMAAVYRSGDVLVFPTLDDVWGLVVNEALWSGLPALVSVYAGCARELVPADSAFDPLDEADFVAKLRRAIAGQLPRPDQRRLQRIGEVSRRIVGELNATLRVADEDPARP